MADRRIPRREWDSFFDELSVRYQGWTASVEALGDYHLDLPAERTFDLVEADIEDGEDTIIIDFADAPPISIEHPTRVWLQGTEEGEDNVLEIESAEWTLRMKLRFPVEEVMEGLE